MKFSFILGKTRNLNEAQIETFIDRMADELDIPRSMFAKERGVWTIQFDKNNNYNLTIKEKHFALQDEESMELNNHHESSLCYQGNILAKSTVITPNEFDTSYNVLTLDFDQLDLIQDKKRKNSPVSRDEEESPRKRASPSKESLTGFYSPSDVMFAGGIPGVEKREPSKDKESNDVVSLVNFGLEKR